MTAPLVWLITGTSSGIGRELAFVALARGDKVIATARGRNISKLDDLKAAGAATMELDVTSPLDKLNEVAREAIAFYGRVDVLVNNAGYMAVGAIEESTPEETYDQFNTNLFGALNVTRAFLPYMRGKRSGIIMWMGSIGGWRAVPYGGLYAATKWAIRGISETLNEEISPLGLKSISIDLGYFRTSFLQDSQRGPAVSRIPDYQPITDAVEARFQAYNGKQPGNPVAAVEVLVDLAHGTGAAEGKAFPIVLNLGSDCYSTAKDASEKVLTRLEEWKAVSYSTDFDSA
ncbi:short chain dehydrogenase [Ephemerocybe angulata]|uniref:Short chain dehydrogenase n=1 Tax=Ephemerocybe angulata TaxID=980116 RepID=A0A8H6HVP8_9AGAR|nr:short chain dehydrogenase [Tulosesus angulatus]